MPLAPADNELAAIKRTESQRGIERGRWANAHDKVQCLVAYRRQQYVRDTLDDAHVSPRKLFPEPRNRLWQDQDDTRRTDAECDRAAADAGELCNLLLRLAQLRVSDVDMPEECSSRRRQRDAARVASEQLQLELSLETAHALGHRRLRYAELSRRSTYAAAFDDGKKVAD